MSEHPTKADVRIQALAAQLFEAYSLPEHHASADPINLNDGEGTVWYMLNRSVQTLGEQVSGQSAGKVKRALRVLRDERKIRTLGIGTYFVRAAPKSEA